jgi:hypothetical protein
MVWANPKGILIGCLDMLMIPSDFVYELKSVLHFNEVKPKSDVS